MIDKGANSVTWPPKKCGTCRFYWQQTSNCHFNPPTVIAAPQPEYSMPYGPNWYNVRPAVAEDDFCGHWAAATHLVEQA